MVGPTMTWISLVFSFLASCSAMDGICKVCSEIAEWVWFTPAMISSVHSHCYYLTTTNTLTLFTLILPTRSKKFNHSFEALTLLIHLPNEAALSNKLSVIAISIFKKMSLSLYPSFHWCQHKRPWTERQNMDTILSLPERTLRSVMASLSHTLWSFTSLIDRNSCLPTRSAWCRQVWNYLKHSQQCRQQKMDACQRDRSTLHAHWINQVTCTPKVQKHRIKPTRDNTLIN